MQHNSEKPRTSSELTELVRQATANLAEHATSESQRSTQVIVDEAVSSLIDALGKGDIVEIERALVSLGAPREGELYTKVGNLARSFHESLKDFAKSLDRGNLTMTSTNIPDAAAKLESVIQLTYEAAQKTMNMVDEQMSLIEKQKAILLRAREAMESREVSDRAFREKCSVYFTSLDESLQRTSKVNSEILVAQEYQDLTGQSLKKVVNLVTGLEKNLLVLIKLFGVQYEAVKPEDTNEKVNQDEADALLSSFGF